MKRGRSVAVGAAIALALAILIGAFFNRLAAGNLILARGDPLLYFYPYWRAAADALAEGRIPLWNPSLFMGAPFLANSQVGFLYPLNWPFWLLLPTPYAATFSLLAHLFIAALGTYSLGRRCLSLTRPSAFLAGVLFALGGYLTAQVEHVNQVQGIAWLPWYFVVLCHQPAEWGDRRRVAVTIAATAAILTLQILTGHTQTVFISLAAVTLWLLVAFFRQRADGHYRPEDGGRWRTLAKEALAFFGPFVLAMILAVAMSAAQLLPTLELSRHSLRQGGLPQNEVLSFSLQPLLLAQSLLPAYEQTVFSEYFLALPISVLLLAALGVGHLKINRRARPLLIVGLIGLALALGRYNPLYYLLAQLPGFDLFRAPARWSVLYALVISLLAAVGWEALFSKRQRRGSPVDEKQQSRPLLVGAGLILVLIAWRVASVYVAEVVPTAAEVIVEQPTLSTLAAWIGELVVAGALFYLVIRGSGRIGIMKWLAIIGSIVVLFLGTRILPYNHPTTPQAFFDLRPPIARLQAAAECAGSPQGCESQATRLLGLSDIFFDVGDQAEIESIYGDQLGSEAMFDYLVAIKQKEILGPNLPLAFGLQSVDGFDGGVLPLARYARLMELILPEGVPASDGRLREHLDEIPAARWLDLFGARYIITDKVGDEWRRDVFFDLKHPVEIGNEDDPLSIGYLPAYEATEVWLVADGPPGTVHVLGADGQEWALQPTPLEPTLWQAKFPGPTVAAAMSLAPCQNEDNGNTCADAWSVKGLALVDERDGTFMPLVAGQYRLIHSGDVKIYENLDVLPRAALLYDWDFVADETSGLQRMNQAQFDPRQRAIVLGEGPPANGVGRGDVSIMVDEPERIVLHSESDGQSLLLLADAHYPGWQATVDGQPAEIVATDVLFRGVFLPPGDHEIIMEFEPASFAVGRVISLAGLLVWIGLLLYIVRSSRPLASSEAASSMKPGNGRIGS